MGALMKEDVLRQEIEELKAQLAVAFAMIKKRDEQLAEATKLLQGMESQLIKAHDAVLDSWNVKEAFATLADAAEAFLISVQDIPASQWTTTGIQAYDYLASLLEEPDDIGKPHTEDMKN